MSRTQFTSVLNGALAIHEPSLNEILATIGEKADPSAGKDKAGFWDDEFPTVNDLIVCNGVAVVPIHGMMIKRNRWWIVGSDYWAEIITELTRRNDIDWLLLDIDSGGGQVAGTERLGDAIWKARQAGKMTIACVNEFCASAALWAAAQCEHIVIPATGSIGSLGVYTLHFDDTKYLAENGVEKSVIYRGKYKAVDERPLDKDAAADMQRFIDGKYSSFVDAVARGRGIDAAEVESLWGDSRLFTGIEAVSNGLADEIGTLQDVLDSLQAGRNGRVSIDVLPAGTDPETDPDGESNAMKLNATGQILDTAGKVIGHASELQIDAASLTKYFAAQTGELIESAVKTAKDAAAETLKAELASASKAAHERLDELVAAVGAEKAIAAFKAGETVEKAKAGLADDLAAQLKAKDEEIAKLKASGNAGSAAPKFTASDAGGAGDGKAAAGSEADPDADFAKAFETDGEGFASLKHFAAFKRYEAKQKA